MSIETFFMNGLIHKAEARLKAQAAIVESLPSGCPTSEAVQACDIMQSMNDRLMSLRLEREKLAVVPAR